MDSCKDMEALSMIKKNIKFINLRVQSFFSFLLFNYAHGHTKLPVFKLWSTEISIDVLKFNILFTKSKTFDKHNGSPGVNTG